MFFGRKGDAFAIGAEDGVANVLSVFGTFLAVHDHLPVPGDFGGIGHMLAVGAKDRIADIVWVSGGAGLAIDDHAPWAIGFGWESNAETVGAKDRATRFAIADGVFLAIEHHAPIVLGARRITEAPTGAEGGPAQFFHKGRCGGCP